MEPPTESPAQSPPPAEHAAATDGVDATPARTGQGEVADAPPSILVVDDSPDMRDLLDEVLRSAGYAVRTAASGGRALAMMGEAAPDLVITDLLMPGMSGFALRSAMLRRPELAAIPVIVLSAYWRRPSDTLEASDVLGKPVNVERLLGAVASHVPQRHRADA